VSFLTTIPLGYWTAPLASHVLTIQMSLDLVDREHITTRFSWPNAYIQSDSCIGNIQGLFGPAMEKLLWAMCSKKVIRCLVETTIKPTPLYISPWNRCEASLFRISISTHFCPSAQRITRSVKMNIWTSPFTNINKDNQGNITPSWQN
jgi:hypothetical protein